MARINARAKGASGEREFCDWLFINFKLAVKPTRNIEQVRESDADIICSPFAFEVKRVEGLDLYSAWTQVIQAVNNKDARAFGLEPVVAYRENGKKWSFLIRGEHLGIEGSWIQLTEVAFKKWVPIFIARNNYERIQSSCSNSPAIETISNNIRIS